jgi:hypothetical protein
VRLRHGYIQDRHKIFVTSARLAEEYNANRTKDDKLRVGVLLLTVFLHNFLCLCSS